MAEGKILKSQAITLTQKIPIQHQKTFVSIPLENNRKPLMLLVFSWGIE